MFREMRRKKQKLTEKQCIDILKEQKQQHLLYMVMMGIHIQFLLIMFT